MGFPEGGGRSPITAVCGWGGWSTPTAAIPIEVAQIDGPEVLQKLRSLCVLLFQFPVAPPSLQIVFQHDPIPRLPGAQVIQRLIGAAHREHLRLGCNPVPGTKIEHQLHIPGIPDR